MHTVFSVKFLFEKNENKQKRGQGWPTFFKKAFMEHNFRIKTGVNVINNILV